MAFVHSKNARVYVDAFDLSRYFTEASVQAKVDLADTTTFAALSGVAVAKSVIPGVKDGTLSLKGLFDPTVQTSTLAAGSTSGSDAYFFNLLSDETGTGAAQQPSNVEGIVSVAPEGSWAPGKRVWASANVVSDYTVSSPIKNVVSVSATMQCDGGVMTGASLKDPGTTDALPTTYVTATAQTLPVATLNVTGNPVSGGYASAGTILVPLSAGGYATVAYTGTTTSTFTGCTGGVGATNSGGTIVPLNFGTGVNDDSLPQESTQGPTCTVASAVTLSSSSFNLVVTQNPLTQGFPQSGQILVPISGTTVTLTYSGLDSTHFLNCTGGAGQVTVSGTITLVPIASVMGAYAFMHVSKVAGAGSTGVVFAKLQHSDDNATWSDVSGAAWNLTSIAGQYGTGQFAGGGVTGGYILFIPQGTQILRFVRVAIGYSGSSTTTAVLVTLVRL